MRRQMATLIAVVVTGVGLGLTPASGQDNSKLATAENNNETKVIQPYRLDFSLSELEDGKKVNTRHYTMNLTKTEGSDEIKIGTRVPVSTGSSVDDHGAKQTQFQYMDVGTKIDARLTELGGELQLHVNSDISNLDTSAPEQHLAPIIRAIKIEGTTLAVVGKPLLLGSVDDPNSKRQFQLEVTITKLR